MLTDQVTYRMTKLHLSENQVMHVGVFPDKGTADKAAAEAKDADDKAAAVILQRFLDRKN